MTPNCPPPSAVILTLVIFGLTYNHLTTYLLNHGYAQGYMGLIVAFGVAATLIGAYFIVGRQATEWTFYAFIASGTPMLIGSICRYARQRHDHCQLVQRQTMELLNDKTTES